MNQQLDLIGHKPDWMTDAHRDVLYGLAATSHGLRCEMDAIQDILGKLEPRTRRYDRYMARYNSLRERRQSILRRIGELNVEGARPPKRRYWR